MQMKQSSFVISWQTLKLLVPILYHILCTLVYDGYAKYVYTDGHCSCFPLSNKPFFLNKEMFTKQTRKKEMALFLLT